MNELERFKQRVEDITMGWPHGCPETKKKFIETVMKEEVSKKVQLVIEVDFSLLDMDKSSPANWAEHRDSVWSFIGLSYGINNALRSALEDNWKANGMASDNVSRINSVEILGTVEKYRGN